MGPSTEPCGTPFITSRFASYMIYSCFRKVSPQAILEFSKLCNATLIFFLVINYRKLCETLFISQDKLHLPRLPRHKS